MSLQPAPKARSPKAAEQRFEEVLQYSLTCLSRAVWRAAATIRGPQGSMVLLTSEYPLRLRRQNGEDLYFSPALDFRYEEREDWHCKTLAYTYTLHTADAVELMSWQWRMGSSQLPHLHVRAEMENLGGAIRKLHLPTGRVAFRGDRGVPDPGSGCRAEDEGLEGAR